MAVVEVRWTPTIRSLVKRRKSNLNHLIRELGGEQMNEKTNTAEMMARRVMQLFRALPDESQLSEKM